MTIVQKTGLFNALVGKLDDVLQYAIGDPMRYVVNWGRMYSLWPVHLETACCTTPNTVILGDNKAISAYQIGDHVIGATGHVGIRKTFAREFEGDLIQVSGRGMLPFFVTPEHPILTVERTLRRGKESYSNEKTWKEAGELVQAPAVKKDDRFLYSDNGHDCVLIPRVKGFMDLTSIPLAPYAAGHSPSTARGGGGKGPPFHFPLDRETAWLLGCYTAKGLSTKDHDVRFTLGYNGNRLVEPISVLVQSLGYSPQADVGKAATTVNFSSSMLARAFEEWCGRLTERKIPDFILYHRDTQILKAFLRGYFEGNRSETGSKRGRLRVRACTVSKVLAQQLQFAYARLGQFAPITLRHHEVTSKAAGRLVKPHDVYDISTAASQRKVEDVQIGAEFIAVPIVKISRVGYSGKVNNLETEDNTYLISNAVVHNCSVEVGAAAGARFDMERFGCLEAFGSLRQCDLLIVMGTVTRKLAPRLKMVYDQMAEPKYVLAMGACSITGGLYFDSYNVLRGIDDIIPVDVYIPGCPPRAEAFLQGMILLEEKIKRSNTLSGR